MFVSQICKHFACFDKNSALFIFQCTTCRLLPAAFILYHQSAALSIVFINFFKNSLKNFRKRGFADAPCGRFPLDDLSIISHSAPLVNTFFKTFFFFCDFVRILQENTISCGHKTTFPQLDRQFAQKAFLCKLSVNSMNFKSKTLNKIIFDV